MDNHIMENQPKALRLADALEQQFPVGTAKNFLDGEAAAELRRLHEAHDWQYRMAGYRLRRVEKLEAERDELLAAVKYIANFCQLSLDNPKFRIDEKACDLIRAAIAKATA